MFVVSELISLIALKNNYVENSSIAITGGGELIKEVQRLGNEYFSLMTVQQMLANKADLHDHSAGSIAFKTMRDETTIRNPGIPEHHLNFPKSFMQVSKVRLKMLSDFPLEKVLF